MANDFITCAVDVLETCNVVFELIEADWRIYAWVIKPPLVQLIACRLVGAKPSPEPMLEYC